MKKSILFVLFTFLSVTVFSQVTWNAKAGMNLSNYTGDNDMNAKVGFKIGGGLEYGFTDLWSLQPSLFVSTKGAKYDDATLNAVYLELPVMAAARINVADNTNIVISAGPYFAYGIGGKTSIGDHSVDTFGDDGLNRFDAGLGLGVAAEFGKVVVGLDGQLGLAEVQKLGNPKNINFSITLGYKF
ncbi:MAG: porin family protein [Bacteroides sp.]|uniref:porin family protein n=1 Tax=Bacteroides sp. TaxID=29523 RepID=UPI002FC6140A